MRNAAEIHGGACGEIPWMVPMSSKAVQLAVIKPTFKLATVFAQCTLRPPSHFLSDPARSSNCLPAAPELLCSLKRVRHEEAEIRYFRGSDFF